jgi:peroxiredoxin
MERRRHLDTRASAWLACAMLGLTVLAGGSLGGAEEDPIKAWEEFQAASRKPSVPAIWKVRQPTAEEKAAFRKQQVETIEKTVDKAREFYTRFPQDPNAFRAAKKEWESLSMLVQMGQTNRQARLEEAEARLLADKRLDEEDRFEIRSQALNRQALGSKTGNLGDTMEEYERGARQLLKEFPDRGEPYETLLMVAENSPRDKALKLLPEISTAARASEKTKTAALEIMQRLNLIGTRPDFKLKTVDGRDLDLAAMRGKVVVLMFWATWCPVCVIEMPHNLEVHARFLSHPVEFIGISQDREKDALTRYVAEKEIPWPQCHDADRKLSNQLRVAAIPTTYLIDKKGVLREIIVGAGQIEQPIKDLMKE